MDSAEKTLDLCSRVWVSGDSRCAPLGEQKEQCEVKGGKDHEQANRSRVRCLSQPREPGLGPEGDSWFEQSAGPMVSAEQRDRNQTEVN